MSPNLGVKQQLYPIILQFYKLWSITGAAICRILEYHPQFILVCVQIFSLKSQSFQAKTPLKAVILCVLCHFLLYQPLSYWSFTFWGNIKPVV